MISSMLKRFSVALSFPGEHRIRVEAIAISLADRLGRDRILYAGWHAAEFNRGNLDTYLGQLYYEDSELVAAFLSKEYKSSEWCGLELRVLRDLLKRKQDDRVMFFRLDDVDIPGIYSIDGYQDIQKLSNEEVANSILERLAQITRGTQGGRTDAIGAPTVTENTNDIYSNAVRAIRGMLLPDEQMISQISGALQVESSDQGRFQRLTSMGHGAVGGEFQIRPVSRSFNSDPILPLQKKMNEISCAELK
jgi:hypothetical protein